MKITGSTFLSREQAQQEEEGQMQQQRRAQNMATNTTRHPTSNVELGKQC